MTKPRDRSECAIPPSLLITCVSPKRPHVTPTPGLIASNHLQEADPDEFSRQLKISISPHLSPRPHQKLYNPNLNTISMRSRQDPELLVEHGQSHLSSHPTILSRPQPHSPQRENAQQHQLFDHRKDDPVRFSNMTRPDGTPQVTKPLTPSPRSSVDYISASSTSSYAQSTLSSNFTLSTDGSSTSSASSEGKPQSETTGTVISAQLKHLYCKTSLMEAKVSHEYGDKAVPEKYNLIMQLWLHGQGCSEVSEVWRRRVG